MVTALFLLHNAGALHAQTNPCRDTVVRILDSICEGQTYSFNGRQLDHSGLFFDTLPRVNDTLCDSIVILRLSVLFIPTSKIYHLGHCRKNIGYDLISGFPTVTYYLWTSQPEDSTLFGQENNNRVHVNPQEPTTYRVHLDYRESPPQCPFDTSISINPIGEVFASMYAEPDEITYDNMHIIVEDFSIGTREYRWGGWAGRNWYINGVRQVNNSEWAEFYGDPSWGDTVHIMMDAYSPTCLDTAYKDIPFRRVALFFPNVFTPDETNNNRFFIPSNELQSGEVWIYSRQCILITHFDAISGYWDGTYKGRPCPQDSYVWIMRYSTKTKPRNTLQAKGTVTLLR
jgi:gliding motility-associated-like protein